MRILLITALIVLGLQMQPLQAQWSIKGNTTEKNTDWNLLQKFTPKDWDASNFSTEEEMKWFNDARYGMFIHFGLSTYIGKDLSWGMCYTRKAPDSGHGPIADSIWTKYPKKFLFPDFDAKKWVEIAKKAGMKYIVTIAKHHDGFHMWDTKYSNFKVTNTPFGRDYLKELADACHEAGMKFGIYYSQRDWYHPDYEPVDVSKMDPISEPPFYKPKPGFDKVPPGKNHQKYIDYQYNVVRELCTNYGKVDVFWFDACWWGGMFTAEMWDSENLTRMIRKLQPGIIINNRASVPGDFDTPEQKIGMYQERPWESCLTLCETWSWSDTPSKTKNDLIKILSTTACGNGNALLSWGPKWDGAFDPKQVTRLEELGDWLDKYGQTIYNTKGGPWYPEEWGGATYYENKVYLHITGETGNRLVLPALPNKVRSAKCLTGGEIKYVQTAKAIALDLAKVNRKEESIIIELTIQEPIKGMAANRNKLSVFSDPVYGALIFNKKAIKPKNGIITIDLGKQKAVTGVGIQQLETKTSEDLTVEVSADGSSWKKAKQGKLFQGTWEITVSRFNAGIELPGDNVRFIRISSNAGNTTKNKSRNITIYGLKQL